MGVIEKIEKLDGFIDDMRKQVSGYSHASRLVREIRLDVKKLIPSKIDIADDYQVKPPIGLKPRTIPNDYSIQRFHEVRYAIIRYLNAGKQIDLDWIKEYNELIDLANTSDILDAKKEDTEVKKSNLTSADFKIGDSVDYDGYHCIVKRKNGQKCLATPMPFGYSYFIPEWSLVVKL